MATSIHAQEIIYCVPAHSSYFAQYVRPGFETLPSISNTLISVKAWIVFFPYAVGTHDMVQAVLFANALDFSVVTSNGEDTEDGTP